MQLLELVGPVRDTVSAPAGSGHGHSPWRAVHGDAVGQRRGRPRPQLRGKVSGTLCSGHCNHV